MAHPTIKKNTAKTMKNLRSLNESNLKTINPTTKRRVLIFGPSHIKSIYNFSLTEQNKIINKFKTFIDRKDEVTKFKQQLNKEEDQLKQALARVQDLQKKIDLALKTKKKEAVREEIKRDFAKVKEEEQTRREIRKIDLKRAKFLPQKDEDKKNYSCHALIFRRMTDDDKKNKQKSTIKDTQGRKYIQIAAPYANVRGNILHYDNTRTYRPQRDDVNVSPVMNRLKLAKFKQLLHLLAIDPDVKKRLQDILISGEIDCIIIKDTVEQEQVRKHFHPLKQRLFSGVAPRAICHKDISYELNKKATTFGEMFDIQFNQYTIDNFKANSCYINTIVDTWHDPFEKRKSDGKRMFVELTYELVCQIIGLKYKDQDLGASIHESKKFFEKFRLGLDVINEFSEILFSYRPEKGLNSHIFPQVLRMLVKNNHCYKLDKCVKNKLDKIRAKYFKNDPQLDEVRSLSVSNKYHLRKPVLDNCKLHFITNIDECVQVIQSTEDNTQIRFLTNTNLLEILYEMTKTEYDPKITFGGQRILSLGFKVGKVNATIENTDNTTPDDISVELSDTKSYEEFHKANDDFYNKILLKNIKSEYPDQVLDIEEKYPMGPLTGYFTKKFEDEKVWNGIDGIRAYTHELQQIENAPVFGYFDIYQPYDNHKIEDLTWYCVETEVTDFASSFLFPTTSCRCIGFCLKLAQFNKIPFTIKSFRRPYHIEHVNFKHPIETLYANPKVSDSDKKDIVNKTTGLLEKRFNTAHVCKVFHNFTEAQYYQIKYENSKIYSLQQSTKETEINDIWADTYSDEFKILPDDQKERLHLSKEELDSLDLDELCKKYPNKLICGKFKPTSINVGPKIHVLVIEKKERLVDGFKYIKEMIYQKMAMRMFVLFNLVVSKGIIPKGIKTDAILVSESKEELEKLLPFTFIDTSGGTKVEHIGGYKFESGKSCTNNRIFQRQNEPFNIKQPEVTEFKIKDEWKYDEFRELFDDDNNEVKNNWIIKGEFPGVGKTTTITQYKHQKLLFATPFNKLAQQTRIKGHHAITLNMLLGIFGDGQEYVKMKKYDVKNYDCICFDEILMNPPKILQRVFLFMKQHPQIKFFSTGDVDQLQPIDFNPNNVDSRAYLLQCVNQMFPNQITLKINKRLKTDEQRKQLKALKKDIFDLNKNVLDTIKKHGFKIITKFSEIKTTQNICYFKYKVKQVNNYVHKNLINAPKRNVKINNVKYWDGLEQICKEHYKCESGKLFKNYSYVITSINQNEFVIRDIVEDSCFTFPIKMLSHFQLPYANTCHCVQGLSIDGPITIFDVNNAYTDRYYVWTALTRSTDLKNITVYQDSDEDVQESQYYRIKRYVKDKVNNYKYQDKISGRTWKPEDYVTAEWIKQEYGQMDKKSSHCFLCRTPYEINVQNGKVTSNLTVDRIDNKIAHIQSNCRLCCSDCNRAKH